MSTYATQERTIIPALAPNIAQKINALHADVQRKQRESRQKLNHAATAAWQAGKLLLEAKASVVRHGGHGAWTLWVKAAFSGDIRTAQKYMKLARELPDAPAPEGMSLRQLYFRLGIATEPKTADDDSAPPLSIPPYIVLANKLVRALRRTRRAINPRDLAALYAQLQGLFEAAGPPP